MHPGCALIALLIAAPVPHRTVADVEDVYSLRYNPAGLGFVRDGELRLVAGRSITGAQTDLGLFAAVPFGDRFTVGGALEWDGIGSTAPALRPSLGAGLDFSVGALGFGWSNLDPGSIFNAGLTVRPWRSLSGSFGVVDLGQNVGPRLYDLGLAVRPFGERLTIGARWRLRQRGELAYDEGKIDVEARVDVEPFDGVFIGVGSDLNLNVSAQIGVLFDKLFIGSAAHFGSSDSLLVEVGYSGASRPAALRRARVAVLELSGDLEPDPDFSLLSQSFSQGQYGAAPLLLDAMTESPQVGGLLLKIGPLDIGWAKASELRRGIGRVRASGRRVHCHLTGASDISYYVATACEAIAMPPSVLLAVDGVAANATYLAEGLDRLGIDPQVVAIGAYKTAPQRFTNSGMSPEDRESVTAIIDGMFESLVSTIVQARGIDRDDVIATIDLGTQTATLAVANRFIDEVAYPDEIEGWLAGLYGGSVEYIGGANISRARRTRWTAAPRIAVINVDATISGGTSRNLPFGLGRSVGAATLFGAIETARTDPAIHAVVLRVDSPGGDATASDLIARAIRRLNETKPVIASFGDVAASGGYYVASGARVIYAEPTTITGSIGVYSMSFSTERLLARLGVSSESVTRGEGSNRRSNLHQATEPERAITRKEIEAAYGQFLRTVAEGRHMTRDAVHQVAQGRVWIGAKAKELGLVDETGGLVDAVARARVEAGIPAGAPAEVITLPASRTTWRRTVREVLAGPIDTETVVPVPAVLRDVVSAVVAVPATGAPLALMPFVLDVD